MEKYESKQQQIRRPAAQVYAVLSDFRNFTPIIQDKVDNWQATENSCSFKVKGITMRMAIIDKEPENFIKLTGEDGSPLDFTFWIQMKEVAPYDTRIRLVLHARLNMMMKMMVGSKLQEGIDMMAEQMANAFNGIVPENFDPERFAAAGFDMYGFGTEGATESIPAEVLDPDDLPEEYKNYTFNFPDPDKPVS